MDKEKLSYQWLKKIDDRASFQTKLLLTATDLKAGHELDRKLFNKRFKSRKQEKKSFSASRLKNPSKH